MYIGMRGRKGGRDTRETEAAQEKAESETELRHITSELTKQLGGLIKRDTGGTSSVRPKVHLKAHNNSLSQENYFAVLT